MSEYDWTWIHRRMLNDGIRTEAFRDAIEKTVKPGDIVADVGAGTGILSLFAARAGAARVYAIERTPTIEQAKAIAKANGVQDQIEFIWAEARKAKLPEKVDVIISEWLGHGGLDEDMFPAVLSVRDRYLKPGGVMIPATMTAFLAPIESADSGGTGRSRRYRPHAENRRDRAPPLRGGRSHAVENRSAHKRRTADTTRLD